MNFKKQAFSEQFLWPRKVLSGFGLGIVVTVIVLGLLMLNTSLRGPTVEPILQGFPSVRAKSVASRSSSESQKPGGLVKKFGDGKVMGKTHVENVSQIAVSENFDAVIGQVSVSEKTRFENFTEQVKNGSFAVEKDGVQQHTHQVNGSVVADSLDFNGVVVKPPLPNFPEMVRNKSFSGEAGRVVVNVSFSGKEDLDEGQTTVGTSLKNPRIEASKEVRENNNVSNILYNAEVSNSFLEGKNGSEANRGGNSTENDETNISNCTSQLKKMQSDSYEKCDIFDGKWVRDDSKPYYPRGSCRYVDKDFDCHLNGRPDDGYLKWKWQPNACDIPR